MTSCRCTAIKNLTADLARLDPEELDEIGLGARKDLEAFNRFVDVYRVLFYVRRGLPLSGYTDTQDIYDRNMVGVMAWEEFECLPTIKAAVALLRASHAPPGLR